MKRKKNWGFKLLIVLLIISIVLISTEYFLNNFFHTSICQNNACLITDYLIDIDRNFLLILALIYFLMLLIFLLLFNYSQGDVFFFFILFFLNIALIFDTQLILKMFLEFNIICWFCLSVFLLNLSIFVLFMILYKNKKISLSQFLFIFIGMVVIYILLNHKSITKLPSSNYILVYSENCPACKDVLEKISNKNTLKSISLVPIYKLYPFIKIFDIQKVPILLIKEKNRIEIYSGYDDVLKQLSIPDNEPICTNKNNQTGGLCVIP